MEHHREPEAVEAGMESDSEWVWKMQNEQKQRFLSSGAVFSRYRGKSYIISRGNEEFVG